MRTSAIEVSIQAVSPELGVQFSSTAFLGSGLPAQAGGMASVAGAGVASSAYELGVNAEMLRKRHSSRVNTRAIRPARDGFLNVMIVTPVGEGAGSEGRGVGFAGADAHGAVDAVDEDLAVADLAGLGGHHDRVDGLV